MWYFFCSTLTRYVYHLANTLLPLNPRTVNHAYVGRRELHCAMQEPPEDSSCPLRQHCRRHLGAVGPSAGQAQAGPAQSEQLLTFARLHGISEVPSICPNSECQENLVGSGSS